MSTTTQVQKSSVIPKQGAKTSSDILDDHLQYLDEMVEKSIEINQIVKDMGNSHAQHKTNLFTAGGTQWRTQADIDILFKSAVKRQEEMTAALADMKTLIEEAKSTFAVDAPDGETDWHVKTEMEEIKHIIDDAAVMEDPTVIQAKHDAQAAFSEKTNQTLAVDAPDGEADWYLKDQMEEIEHLIDDAARTEDTAAINVKHDHADAFREETKHTLAVDAPDGETDWHLQEEKLEINHIIEATANFEDPAVLKKKHMMEENMAAAAAKTFAVDAPDGDSDGHLQEELYEIKHIIDEASKVEDAEEIKLRHQAEQKVRQFHSRDAEHDW
jgi:outer membrane protein assembly factor BamB